MQRECAPINFEEYVASIPGLLATFEAAQDSILIPLTKALIRYLKDVSDWEEALSNVDRMKAIAHWYRQKFTSPDQWQLVIEALSLTDITPNSPQNDDDLFDALMSLKWEELTSEMRARLKAVGFDPDVIEDKPIAELKRRIRTSVRAYSLDRMPALLQFSEVQLWQFLQVLSIGHAYPKFKDRIRSILIAGAKEPETEYA